MLGLATERYVEARIREQMEVLRSSSDREFTILSEKMEEIRDEIKELNNNVSALLCALVSPDQPQESLPDIPESPQASPVSPVDIINLMLSGRR